MNKYKIIIFIISIILFIAACSEKNVKSEKESTNDKDKIAAFSLPPDTQPLTAAILDFTNKTNNKIDEIYRTQIPDQLSVDISSWFSLIPNTYTRKTVKKLSEEKIPEIKQNDLFDQDIAKQIGKELNVDVIIIGQYSVFGDDIQIIVYMLHVNKPDYQNFHIDGKKKEILKLMNQVSLKTMGASKVSFKPIKIKEKKLIEEATAEYVLEKISQQAVKESYKAEQPRSIVDDNIIEENPSPAPKWINIIPEDKEYIYYVGRAYEEKIFSEAFKHAVENAFAGISRIVGTSVDSQYVKIQKSIMDGDNDAIRTVIKQNLIVRSLNNIRGAQIEQQYYRKYKSPTNKKEFLNDYAVLYKISKENIKNGIKESIELEKVRAEERKLLAEKEKIEAERKLYLSQMNLLKKMKEKEIEKITQPKQNPLYIDNNASKKDVAKTSKTDKKDVANKQTVTNPYRLYSYISGGLGILGLGYGIYQGINMNSLISESNDLEDEYKALVASNPQSDFVAKLDEANSKRNDARSAELQMYIFGGVGTALIGTGVYLFLYEEEVPLNVVLLDNYSELSIVIRF